MVSLIKDGKKYLFRSLLMDVPDFHRPVKALPGLPCVSFGMEVSFEQLDNTEDRGHAGTFDLLLRLWHCYWRSLFYLMNNYGTGGTNNFGRYSNEEVDKLESWL